MAKPPKAAKADAVDTTDTTEVSAKSVPASSKTGGNGNPADSPDAPPETATGNPDGGSNGVEMAPAATVDGVGKTDAKTTAAPEPATVALPSLVEADTANISLEPASEKATANPAAGSGGGAPARIASAELADTETAGTPVVSALTPVEVKLEQEPFTLVLPTVHGGKLKSIGETVWLTREKHAAFVLAGRVVVPWPDTTN